jgi:hypothetical protein
LGILKDEMEYQPIIFEEVFAIDKDPKFVQMVKQSGELTEQKILESCGASTRPQTKDMQIGVHLFVMCHGF